MGTLSAGTIRPRTDADLPALAALLIEVHERDGYPVEGVADPREWLTPAGMLAAWVAEVDGEVVGHVLLTHPGEGDEAAKMWMITNDQDPEAVAVLGRLFVSSTARGQHLGQRLTLMATRHADELGRKAVLDVMAKDAAATRTYEALGWQRLGPISHRLSNGRTEPAFAYVSPDTTPI